MTNNKEIKIPTTYDEKFDIYTISLSSEFWGEFKDLLKSIAKIKHKKIRFIVKKIKT